MKIEIINPSTQEVIETYSVPDLSMLDFQQWKNKNEIIIHLNCLLDKVENLDSKDSEINEPISNPRVVDFYLPDPIKNQAISRFAESKTETGELSDHILNEMTEQVSMPRLKSSTILSAVVTEILQNHSHSDYKARISDE